MNLATAVVKTEAVSEASPAGAGAPAPSVAGPAPTFVVRARPGWEAIDFAELWRFRDLLWVLALRDIQVRYKQTVLGALWAIIQPVAYVVIFGTIFGQLLGVARSVTFKYPDGSTPPYTVFLFAGQLPWLFFSSAVTASSMSLLNNANMLRKVYFPRLMMPASAIGAPLVDFCIAMTVLAAVMAWYQVPVTGQFVLLPLLMVSSILAAFGVGVFLAALTINYRDFKYVVPFMMQIMFFATPVLYEAKVLEQRWWGKAALYLNPMAGPVDGFRSVVLGTDIHYAAWASSTVVSLALTAVGVLYFNRVERRFADVS